jgi:hypothetical protein
VKGLRGTRLPPDVLDAHTHICDLINVEYPVLQLFTDGKRNWIYLWCERDIAGANRWLVFPTSRTLLVQYLESKATMRKLVIESRLHFILDTNQPFSFLIEKEKPHRRHRRNVTRVTLDQLADYLPSEDSYFDKELTSDLDLSKELTPTLYSVPIDGDWFSQDFTFLFKVYERIYAFFYSTQPCFVRTLSQNLERSLRSPWTGGYSRINLFSMLARQVPGLHSLKVQHIKYASPGKVTFEAISSVGESVRVATNALVEHEEAVTGASKRINKVLTEAGLNRTDLSEVSDANAPLNAIQRAALDDMCDLIAAHLGVTTEFATLQEHSPNIVVYAKAVVSFVRQLTKLASLHQQQMLDFSQSASTSNEHH